MPVFFIDKDPLVMGLAILTPKSKIFSNHLKLYVFMDENFYLDIRP